ncbi:MAG: MFS transporter [SAR202 cluster bacterium]|nr:MFS transporter [SAR202 cluster bacterium]
MRSPYGLLYAQFPFHGWLIVAVTFLASALSIGPGYAFGLFIDPLQDAFGWQRTAVSASLSFAAVGSLTSPLLGKFMDRFGARPLMAVSLTIMGTSFLLRPLMTELWHWYALSFLQYLAFSGSAGLPAGRLVGIWFAKSRGRVMGITTMGNNFGGFIVPLITGFLLASGNWEAAFLILAGLTYFVALLSILVIRERPYRKPGPDGQGAAGIIPPELEGWTVREALHSRSFYTIGVALSLGAFTYSAVLPQISDHLISQGMSRTTVPFAISLLAAFGMMGKLSFGYLSERFTARRMLMVSLSGQIVFIAMIVRFPTEPMAWLAAPAFGLFMGAFGALVPLLVQEAFGLRNFGTIAGLISTASVIPFFSGPLLAGSSFDIADSYGPGFLIVAVMFAMAVATLSQGGAVPGASLGRDSIASDDGRA